MFRASTDYVKVRVLGHGSFGEASLVQDARNPAACYVVKVCNLAAISSKGQDEAQRKKLIELTIQEADVMRTLTDQPCVVHVFSSFLEGDFFHIVMEFCDSGTLKDAIEAQNGEPFQEAKIRVWTAQLAMTLKYLHIRNILHRDVKSENVFLTSSGSGLKLGDFGVAKSIGGGNNLSSYGVLIGTFTHSAPEVWAGNAYSFKSEVWALGVVVYEMIALELPFRYSANNIPALINAICNVEFREFVLTKLLERDVAKRPEMADVICHACILPTILAMTTAAKASDIGAHQNEAQRGVDSVSKPSSSRSSASNTGKLVSQEAAEQPETTRTVSDCSRSPNCGIGIDLGSTFLRAAFYYNGAPGMVDTQPNIIAFSGSEMLFGDDAKRQMARNPRNTIFDVKRLIGRPFEDPMIQSDMKDVWPFKVIDDRGIPKIEVEYQGGTKRFSPEDIISFLLKNLKETCASHLGCKIDKAVVSVPADFDLLQRLATECACRMAGFTHVCTMSEPIAAAMAFVVAKHLESKEQNVLIVNLGGGTLDASVICTEDGILETRSLSGQSHLGGEEFDNRMIAFCVDEFKSKYGRDISKNDRALCRLRMACQRAKQVLSESTETSIELDSLFEGIDYRSKISRFRLEELCMDLFQRVLEPTERALRYAKLRKAAIDEVILVGGSMHIPKVQQLLQDFFNGKRLKKSIDQEEAVAHGTAIRAAILFGNWDSVIENVLVLEPVPRSLGIGRADGLMEVVVPRGTTIPTKTSGTFTTTCDNQSTVTIDVFEGDSTMVKDNNWIGTLSLSGLKRVPRGMHLIYVTFDIDSQGFIEVSVVEKSSSKESTITIPNQLRYYGSVSNEDIEQLIRHATKYPTADPNCGVVPIIVSPSNSPR